MNKEALALLFYREVSGIEDNQEMELQEKTVALFRLMNLVFVEFTRKEKLHFTTLFARVAYVCHQQKLDGRLEYYIHSFRKYARQPESAKIKLSAKEWYEFGRTVLCKTLAALLDTPVPDELAKKNSDWPPMGRPVDVVAYKPKIRIIALEIDRECDQIVARTEEDSEALIRVQFNLPERNENFNPTIKAIEAVLSFPVVLNLIEVEIDSEGVYRPRAFVVEPDYLMDVSAVAECFKDFGTEPLLYLLKKFLPFTPTKHLLLGNVANFFLDELMNDETHSFRDLFPKVFQLNPLSLCLFEDREIREVMQKSQLHFLNLKRMVLQEFEQLGIDRANSFLEPTFYSETYGLQGRLDVFYKAENGKQKSAIVELKSGKAYKPNAYGISSNHFVQTLLYDLIVRSVYGKAIDPANFVFRVGRTPTAFCAIDQIPTV